MKTIIALLLFTTLYNTAFACRNTVPQSEAEKYIAAADLGQSVPGGKSCQESPGEACLCFDEIEGWDVAKIVNGKLENDMEKLQAKIAAKDVEESNKAIAEAKKAQAKERLKNVNWDNIAAPHKAVLMDLYELLK